MKKRSLLILSMFILGCSASQAIAGSDIYKLVDKDGNITFTNRKLPNAEKISVASYSPNLSTNKSSQNRTAASSTTERSGMRRKILESELLTEQQLFSDTQISLDQASQMPRSESSQQKLVQLKNKLFMHQRNIAALKKELGRF